jgi:DNA-binding GntR family transcriptional regulator
MAHASVSPTAGSAALRHLAIDRNSPVPLYFQVAQHLEDAISSGAIPPGSLFDNEIVLADQLGLSRPTMRRAMQHLVDKGLVVRRRGIGTRVVQPKVRRPLELSSLYDDLARTGQEPTTQVRAFEEVEADEELADRLGVPAGAPVVRVVRLRSAQQRPIAKMTNFLPAGIVDFDAEALEARGLYALLKARGIVLHSATQVVGARTATSAEARLLEEPRGAALLTMQRQTFDDHGAVVEYGTHLYAASRYSFEINLLTT